MLIYQYFTLVKLYYFDRVSYFVIMTFYVLLSECSRLRKRLMLRLYQLNGLPAEWAVSQLLVVYVTLVADKHPSQAQWHAITCSKPLKVKTSLL